MEALVMQLKTKRALLIIDNCEHVIGRVAEVVSAIVRSCNNIRILATSREALNVSSESLYRMPSLSVPATSPRLSREQALKYSAIALFEQRGHTVNPKFSVNDQNAAVIGDICRRLDGIPLAIELAAARLRLLTPAQLLQKLNERFRLLTGGDRTALPRQQTMRALIDWSYDLLSPSEQGLFRTISAFSGGFSVEAASMLGATDALDEMDVLAIISSLLDKSLLQAEHGEEQLRYRLLESTREYAAQRLSESGEREAILQRHAALYAEIAEELDVKYEDTPPAAWISEAEGDIENLRAALAWSFSAGGDALIGQRIAVTLPRLFGVVAPAEGLRLVNQALDRVTSETPPLIVAGLHLAHASFASVFNQFNVALGAGQEAIAVFMTLTHPTGLADAQRLVGRSLLYLGRIAEGEALLKESLSVRQAAGSKRLGGILGDLAVARALRGDLQGARTLFAQATAMFEEGADASKMAITAATLAEAEFLAGDAEAAVHLAHEALDSARSVGRHRTVAAILGNIAAYELDLRNYDRARLHAREALEICRDLQGDVVSVIFALQHLATATMLQGEEDVARAAIRHARAAGLAGFVDARLESLGIEREHTERSGYEKLVQTLRDAVTDDDLQMLMRAGGTWSDERALNEAMAI
ncbi:MAG TPA: tetratricopeptide repeat protein, partial [Candidatus Baltobacteraceae bacterium]|nr:tetratricopeptide repeat protein [Candidatus Baltobacteraceae bacterium]